MGPVSAETAWALPQRAVTVAALTIFGQACEDAETDAELWRTAWPPEALSAVAHVAHRLLVPHGCKPYTLHALQVGKRQLGAGALPGKRRPDKCTTTAAAVPTCLVAGTCQKHALLGEWCAVRGELLLGLHAPSYWGRLFRALSNAPCAQRPLMLLSLGRLPLGRLALGRLALGRLPLRCLAAASRAAWRARSPSSWTSSSTCLLRPCRREARRCDTPLNAYGANVVSAVCFSCKL